LLASSELGRLFLRTAEDDEDDYGPRRRRARNRPDPNRFPKVPSDKGIELMNSGKFGASEIKALSTITQRKKLARRILDRELGIDSGPRRKANQLLMAQVTWLLPLDGRILIFFRA
jgi:WD repeat-containing protein 23